MSTLSICDELCVRILSLIFFVFPTLYKSTISLSVFRI